MWAMSEAGRETGKYDRCFGQHGAIAAVASTQHAVIGLGQLRELGLTETAVHKRAASASLHRVHQGVYSLVPPKLLTRYGRYMAAVLACGPDAVLSHRSAADLLGLRRTDRPRVDVTVPGRSGPCHEGIDGHRSTTLTPADVTTVHGIPCTTVARTLLDLGDMISGRPLERAFDQAEILQVFDLRSMQDQIARNRHRRPAVARAKAIIDTHHIGETPTWSVLEDAFLAMTRGAGIPEPEVNAWILLPDDEPPILADFVWREQRVVVETDGNETLPDATGVRAGSPPRSAAGCRRLAGDPHHLASAQDRAAAAGSDDLLTPGATDSSRARLTSRWRRPSACATHQAARRRKHRI
jgi:predicted transcriptional regulator of viral defense system